LTNPPICQAGGSWGPKG